MFTQQFHLNMNFNALAAKIATTLKSQGSFSIPGLGKFILSYSPSELIEEGRVICPPKIELQFAMEEQTLQGNGEDEVETDGSVKCIEELKRELIEKGSVAIPQIGEIMMDDRRQITFKAAEKNLLNGELFAYKPLPLRPKEGFSSGKAPATERKIELPEEGEQKKMTKAQTIVISIVAAIIIIAAILILFHRQLSPLYEKLLYSKEELELIDRFNR